jgi:hypothetical protein
LDVLIERFLGGTGLRHKDFVAVRIARINLQHSSIRHANPLVVGQTLDGRTIRLLIGSFTSSPNLPSVINIVKGPRPRVISTTWGCRGQREFV